MNATREQLLAQSADRHLAVTAGAGAGKTTVLVERFLHLLMNKRVDVRDITAITFTRKAASEMMSRVAAAVEAMLADESLKPRWEYIKRIRERLNSANISTIHSFCARLLRDFPIEAGVNPNFTELEEYRAAQLREEAITTTLEAWLEDDVDAENAEQLRRQHRARRAWNVFGKRGLQEVLTAILSNAERFEEVQTLYATRSDADLLTLRDTMLLPTILADVQRYAQALEQALELVDMAQMSANNKTTHALHDAFGKLAVVVRQCTALQAQMHSLLQNLRHGSLPEKTVRQSLQTIWHETEFFLGQLEAIKTAVCNADGKIKKTGLKDDVLINAAEFWRINNSLPTLYNAIKGMLAVTRHRERDKEMLEIARILMDIAREAYDSMNAEKERLGALDFDDLQMKADRLLSNSEVQEKVRRSVRFLMIDEFQDTNELQYRIATKILGQSVELLPAGNSSSSNHTSGTTSNATSTDASSVLSRMAIPTAYQQLPPHEANERTQREYTTQRHSTNLFIVGDPKQSIYRFRGADVRVFAKAQQDIYAINRTRLEAQVLSEVFDTPNGKERADNERQTLGGISLSATFRLAPVVAAFVNRVCGKHMRERSSEFDVEYEDIVCGIAKPSAEQGSVTMLLARKPKNDPPQAPHRTSPEGAEHPTEFDTMLEEALEHASEAELLAQYIRHIIVERPVQVRERDGSTRAARYEDVFVLSRSRSGFDALASAFRRAGIPFFVSGGRGFYEKQELLDMRSFLLFLHNTGDDVACAAVLRSPLFTVSDAELYAIARSAGNSFWERACSYYEQHGKPSDGNGQPRCSAEFRRAHGIITALLPLASRLTIPTLLRTIIEQTGWRGVIAADERFEQIEANIEKLLEQARAFEHRGFRNLYDFAEELRILATHSRSEGEADVTLGSHAVTMMTIHASKGLEAPIVVLYNTNSANDRSLELYADTQFGLSFPFERTRTDDNELTVERVTTPLCALAARQHSAAERAEMKRLLYVALTRAKDHLVLSGSLSETKEGMGAVKGFLQMLLQGMDAEELNMLVSVDMPFSDELNVLQNGTRSTRQISYTVSVLHSVEQLVQQSVQQSASSLAEAHEFSPEQQSASAPPSSLPPLLLKPLAVEVVSDTYSASQLRLFERDPDEYERVYRLGLPPSDDEDDDHAREGINAALEDNKQMMMGTLPGTLIHAVLEHITEWMDERGVVDAERLEGTLLRVAPVGSKALPKPLRDRVLSESRAVALTPLVRRLAERAPHALAQWQREYAVFMPLGNDIVMGTIDALVLNEHGEYEIWDWKTNRVSSSDDMTTLLEEYRLQLELYALMLSRSVPEQHKFTARLLFTRRAAAIAREQDWTRSVTFSRAALVEIEKRVRTTIQRVRRLSYGEWAAV